MRVHLPANASLSSAVLAAEIERALIPAISTVEAVPFVLLLSPNHTVYRLAVTDAGTLSVTLVQGPGP